MAFYRADWRHVALVSFAVPRDLLVPLLPRGLAPDLYNAEGRFSVVAKQVLDASLWGVRLPDHRDFSQVSYQTYVKDEKNRRGVLLLRQFAPQEITPKVLRLFDCSLVFEAAKVSREIEFVEGGRDHLERPILDASVKYGWGCGGRLELRTDGLPKPASFGQEEAFYLSREWLFLPRSAGGYVRSSMQTKDWFVWDATGQVTLPSVTQSPLAALTCEAPVSSFLAKGSKAHVGFPRLV